MENTQFLGSLDRGQEATVERITGSGAVTMRLMEIGLVPGRCVIIVRRAPFGGPVELLIDGTRMAVRAAEADRVIVSVPGPAVLADHQHLPEVAPVRVKAASAI